MKPIYLLLLAAPLFLNLHCKKDAEPETTKDPDPCELYGTHDARCRAQELAKLPAYTQVGAGTFGCLLNGKAFIPSTCCGDFFNPPLPSLNAIYYPSEKSGIIGSINKKNDKNSFYQIGLIYYSDFNNIRLPKSYDLKETSNEFNYSGGDISIKQSATHSRYTTYNPNSGTLLISNLDTINQIISGTFEFKAANETDTITITDGRFDLPYSLQ
jgi:hypothetical protein